MDKEYMKPIKELKYASLTQTQEERLRELEKVFNAQYDTKYYFMAMERE